MMVECLKVGYLKCNCYILEKDDKVLVIDPGADFYLIDRYLQGKKVVGVLITHRHFDHVGALEEIVKNYETSVYDFSNLDEKKYNLDNFCFEVIRCPGHALDLVSYYFYEDEIMFTGDFLFKGTIGRCDLEGSNWADMLKSIEKIKNYSDDIVIYPGHGAKSTLKKEKMNNPYFVNR